MFFCFVFFPLFLFFLPSRKRTLNLVGSIAPPSPETCVAEGAFSTKTPTLLSQSTTPAWSVNSTAVAKERPVSNDSETYSEIDLLTLPKQNAHGPCNQQYTGKEFTEDAVYAKIGETSFIPTKDPCAVSLNGGASRSSIAPARKKSSVTRAIGEAASDLVRKLSRSSQHSYVVLTNADGTEDGPSAQRKRSKSHMRRQKSSYVQMHPDELTALAEDEHGYEHMADQHGTNSIPLSRNGKHQPEAAERKRKTSKKTSTPHGRNAARWELSAVRTRQSQNEYTTVVPAMSNSCAAGREDDDTYDRLQREHKGRTFAAPSTGMRGNTSSPRSPSISCKQDETTLYPEEENDCTQHHLQRYNSSYVKMNAEELPPPLECQDEYEHMAPQFDMDTVPQPRSRKSHPGITEKERPTTGNAPAAHRCSEAKNTTNPDAGDDKAYQVPKPWHIGRQSASSPHANDATLTDNTRGSPITQTAAPHSDQKPGSNSTQDENDVLCPRTTSTHSPPSSQSPTGNHYTTPPHQRRQGTAEAPHYETIGAPNESVQQQEISAVASVAQPNESIYSEPRPNAKPGSTEHYQRPSPANRRKLNGNL